MKNSTPKFLSLFFLAVSITASASATLLVDEPFEYSNGSLNGQNGGSGFTGSWSVFTQNSGTLTVVDERASINGSVNTGWASATRSIDTIDYTSQNTFYFSYEIDVSAYSASAAGYYNAFLFMDNSAALFSSGYFIDASGYTFRSQITGDATFNITPKETAIDNPKTIVGKFDYDTDLSTATISYWIDPSSESDTPDYTRSWNIASPTDLTRVRLQRFDDANVANSNVTFDTIRVGTDWNSVTAIPESSSNSLAMALLSILFWVLYNKHTRRS